MNVRADIVALLLDLDMDRSDPPIGPMFHESTGEQFTAWEAHRLGEARMAELRATVQYGRTALEFLESKRDDANRMCELLAGHSREGDDSTPIVEIAQRMSLADQAEFAELLERAAPDGRLVIGGARMITLSQTPPPGTPPPSPPPPQPKPPTHPPSRVVERGQHAIHNGQVWRVDGHLLRNTPCRDCGVVHLDYVLGSPRRGLQLGRVPGCLVGEPS
jgi:hypothetical protein